MESLVILAETFGNTAISRIFVTLRGKIEEGKGIASPLRDAKYFTPMVVTMISVGEESGNLDEMLNEISTHYDDEVHYTISRLTEILGPFLIVCLAVVVSNCINKRYMLCFLAGGIYGQESSADRMF
jgi:type IV pilus assembly protein PilC